MKTYSCKGCGKTLYGGYECECGYKNGLYAIFCEGHRLTDWYETETRAWDELKRIKS